MLYDESVFKVCLDSGECWPGCYTDANFFHQLVFHATTSIFGDTLHHPYIMLVFAENSAYSQVQMKLQWTCTGTCSAELSEQHVQHGGVQSHKPWLVYELLRDYARLGVHSSKCGCYCTARGQSNNVLVRNFCYTVQASHHCSHIVNFPYHSVNNPSHRADQSQSGSPQPGWCITRNRNTQNCTEYRDRGDEIPRRRKVETYHNGLWPSTAVHEQWKCLREDYNITPKKRKDLGWRGNKSVKSCCSKIDHKQWE